LLPTIAMPNERIVELTARMLSGETTPAELEELQSLIREHPEEQHFIELLSEYWYRSEQFPDHDNLHSDEHFRHVLDLAIRTEYGPEDNTPGINALAASAPVTDQAFAQPDGHHLQKRYVWKIATATAAACILFTIYFFYRNSRQQVPGSPIAFDQKREVAVRPGARSRLLLPDGSTVWLNSDSKLTYNNNFNSGVTREVNLEGEAFFDVSKNCRHPFIVHTSGIDIHVLGTAFDVKSYPREPTFEATLIRGKIEVRRNNSIGGSSIVLKPHEKLTLVKWPKGPDSLFCYPQGNRGLSAVKPNVSAVIKVFSGKIPDSAVVETAWVYNKLVFDGETFREITEKLERWFNVKIEIRNPEVSAFRFHASFENETIEEVLKSLQVTAPFDYKINDDIVIISAKGRL
jgi:transmembrane sensor